MVTLVVVTVSAENFARADRRLKLIRSLAMAGPGIVPVLKPDRLVP